MFERYGEKARRALFFARYEASKLGSEVIDTEHLLLGILREGEEAAMRILARFDLEPGAIRGRIERERIFTERVSSTADLPWTEAAKEALAYAVHEADSAKSSEVGSEHLLAGLLRVESSPVTGILTDAGLDLEAVREELTAIARERQLEQQKPQLKLLSKYGEDVTRLAALGHLDPVIERDEILARMIETLCLRKKNNVLLIGEIGSGRKALVQGLAQRVVDGDVPRFLLEKRIFQLKLLVDGARYRGPLGTILEGVAKELQENRGMVLFIDDLHSVFGMGTLHALEMAGVFRPSLSDTRIQCIGATTPSGYQSDLRNDAGFRRHFSEIEVPELSSDATLRILRVLRGRHETHHGVTYTDDALVAVVELSRKHMADRVLPEKAIYLLDASGAHLRVTTLRGPRSEKEDDPQPLVVTREIVETVAITPRLGGSSSPASDEHGRGHRKPPSTAS